MMQIDGGGSGKLLGGLALAGEASGVGGEQLLLRGRVRTPVSFLRRSWVRIKGKKGRVSAVFNGEGSAAREERKREQHGVAVVVSYLGHGRAWRRTRAAAAALPSWRCRRDGGEQGRGSGGVWRE